MRVRRLFALFSVSLFLFSVPTKAQEKVGSISGANSCNYYGEAPQSTVYTFSSDQEALDAIDRVLKPTGLARNFVVRAAAVPNAAAIIDGEDRYIVYSQEFMERVKNVTQTDWAAISILAHELGHHLQGHTLKRGGSRPATELEADEYSGFVLEHMGATLDEAQIAMKKFGSEAGSATHPPKDARLAAIRAGWTRAHDLTVAAGKKSPGPQPQPGSTQPSTQPPTPVDPLPGSPSPAPNQPKYTTQCSFAGDPAAYYIASDNRIIGIAPTGQSIVVGLRIPPTVQGFAWMYRTNVIIYGVDGMGRVWNRAPNGFTYQVGQCSGL